MQIGELSEAVQKRSVLRQLHRKISGEDGYYGADCVPLLPKSVSKPPQAEALSGETAECGVSAFREGTDESFFHSLFCTSAGPLPGYEEMPGLQVLSCVNRLEAGGAAPKSLTVHGILPASSAETKVCDRQEPQSGLSALPAEPRRYDGLCPQSDSPAPSAEAQQYDRLCPQSDSPAPSAEAQQYDRQCPQSDSPAPSAKARKPGKFSHGKASDPTEEALRKSLREIQAAAHSFRMSVADVEIQISDVITKPGYFVTAYGTLRDTAARVSLRPGDTLIMTGWIALGGTAALASHYGEELRRRYPQRLIERAREFGTWLSASEAAQAAHRFGGCAVHSIARGGIFTALWEMAEHAGVGLEAELRRIPVKQETIEICEYFDVNPYYLYSEGALLIGTPQPQKLLARLAQEGIPAAVIGRAFASKERVILNGGERRFLDRPRRDAWWGAAENRP